MDHSNQKECEGYDDVSGKLYFKEFVCPSRSDLGIVQPPGHIRPSGYPCPARMM